MTLTPFLTSPFVIQLHICAALVALLFGPMALYRRVRDGAHKMVGYVWVTAMAMLALSAFAIPSHFTPFGIGPLHGFAVLTLWSLWTGLRCATRRQFEAHRTIFQGLYWNGLIIAGIFSLLPDRTMNRLVFGGAPKLGWITIGLLSALVVIRLIALRRRLALQT